MLDTVANAADGRIVGPNPQPAVNAKPAGTSLCVKTNGAESWLDKWHILTHTYRCDMNAKAHAALLTIRACVAVDGYRVLPHFRQRLARRGLLWTDVLTVLDEPATVRFDGHDELDRPKWCVAGRAVDGEKLEFVCVLDVVEHGEYTVFITIY